MANLGGTFDATQVEPSGDFERLPAGQYEAEIIDSGKEPVSKNDPSKGECLSLTWKIAAGPLEGRLFWQRLNLWFCGAEKTPGKVAEIAQRQLSEICHATGQMNISDSEQLHYRRCLVKYGPQKKDPDFDEVKSVSALNGTAAPAPATQQASPPPFGNQAPPQQAAAGAPSGGGWKRRAG